jgi:hypothetical protein
MSNFRAKNKIMFPNRWALDSFLLRLKRSSGWEFHASNDSEHFKVKPKHAVDYILIGLNKAGGNGFILEINAEKANTNEVWHLIFDFANRYRC